MNSILVANIGENEVEVGYAGHSNKAGVVKRYISWLDEELAVYKMVRSWFHDILLNNPSTCKVVISEPMWISKAQKERLCKALFVKLRVPSICFIPNCMTALFGAGIHNGIFVEVLKSRTEVMPIYDGRMLDNYSRTLNVGYEQKEILLTSTDDHGYLDIDQKPLLPTLRSVINSLPCDTSAIMKTRIIINSSSEIKEHVGKHYSLVDTLGCWAGASLYFCNYLEADDTDDPLEVKLSQYEEEGTIPDWHSNRFFI